MTAWGLPGPAVPCGWHDAALIVYASSCYTAGRPAGEHPSEDATRPREPGWPGPHEAERGQQ